MREVARHAAIGGRGPVMVGSFTEIADELQTWMAETDIDGFNLAYAVTPETFADIVDLVVPELQRRAVYKLDYMPACERNSSVPARPVCRQTIRRQGFAQPQVVAETR